MSQTFEKTRDLARGKWKGILLQLGVDESYLKNVHGPCPICGDGEDRFRWDDDGGNGGYYCNQCGPGSGLKLLMALKTWTFERAAKEVDQIVGTVTVEERKTEMTEEKKRLFMTKLWTGARPVQPGDPVWLYLERRCGDPSRALKDIRYHPALRHTMDGQDHPAMLAKLCPNQGNATGLHRTYLTLDGRKAPVDPVRMVLGECSQVRLGGVQERLGIAEGIETAIAASNAFGLPVWSALNANGMKVWEPPPGVKTVVVFGDNDANFTGQEAAFVLAHRLALKGFAVEVFIPEKVGTDWADLHTSPNPTVAA